MYDELPEPYPVWTIPARLRWWVFVNVFDNAINIRRRKGTIFLILTCTTTVTEVLDQD